MTLPLHVKLFGAALLLWTVNYWAVAWWPGRPVLYCWLEPPVSAVFGPWMSLGLMLSGGYFLYAMIRYGLIGALPAAFIILLIGGAPEFARTLLFASANSCG